MSMHFKITLLCLWALQQIGCKEPAPSKALDPKDTASVRACFNEYKNAILNKDGKAAAALVDESTLNYYGEMREVALEGSPQDVRKLSTVNKLIVLTLRHQMSYEDLNEMTAQALFVHAVHEGWIGKASVVNSEIGEINVSGTHATGVFIAGGSESPIKWTFLKENGEWKIDITSILPIADQAFQQVVLESGLSEEEFLRSILESVSGKKVSDKVWEPLSRSEKQ